MMLEKKTPFKEPAHVDVEVDDHIQVFDALKIIWIEKYWIIGFIITSVIFGFIYIQNFDHQYQTSVVVAPSHEEAMNNISSELGGLASLAGIRLGDGSTNNAMIAKQVLKSKQFARSFIQKYQLKPLLLAAEGWDMEAGEWQYDESKYDVKEQRWLSDDKGKSYEPNIWDAVTYFQNNTLEITEDKKTGILNIKVQSKSPNAAKNWAQHLVKDINEYMRARDVAKSEERLSYLRSQLETTSITEMRSIFFTLIESEIRKVMLARVEPEYVYQVLDPPFIPQTSTAPSGVSVFLISILIGGFIGLIFVFFKNAILFGISKENARKW